MMGGKSRRKAKRWFGGAAWPGREGDQARMERPPAQRQLGLPPESKGAMEGLRQGRGRSGLCVTKNKSTLEGRLRGRGCTQGYKWGLASCSSPVRLYSLLLQEAFPDHSPCGPICALGLWLR